jgi:hypothetical protein
MQRAVLRDVRADQSSRLSSRSKIMAFRRQADARAHLAAP